MKCPYCAEEINDSAIVCRFCHRDFSLLAPLLQRLLAAEKQLQEHAQAMETLSGVTSRRQDLKASEGRPQIIARVLIVAVTSCGSLGLYWLFWRTEYRPMLILSIAYPFLVGLGTGALFRGGHAGMYIILASIIGVIDYVGTMFVFVALKGQFPNDWLFAAGVALVGHAILFVLGGVLADSVEKHFFPERYQSGIDIRVATSLANFSGRRGSPRNVETWKNVISVMTPILSIFSSIIVAYFTYLAALAKK